MGQWVGGLVCLGGRGEVCRVCIYIYIYIYTYTYIQYMFVLCTWRESSLDVAVASSHAQFMLCTLQSCKLLVACKPPTTFMRRPY